MKREMEMENEKGNGKGNEDGSNMVKTSCLLIGKFPMIDLRTLYAIL